MKVVIVAVFAVVVAVAVAAPQNPADVQAEIKKYVYDQEPNGNFNTDIESSNGIKSQAQGVLQTVNDEENKPHDVVIIRGSYSFTDPEGQLHTITYVADENGFHPEGADLPVAPVARR